jgi:hypothetical protein
MTPRTAPAACAARVGQRGYLFTPLSFFSFLLQTYRFAADASDIR